MASSDTTIEVKIAASLDSSMQAATAAAKSEISGLTSSATTNAAALKAVAASEVEVTAATRTMSEGAISTAAREFRALFDELSSGRTRMTPGTLAIIAQRVYGLEASALAAGAGVAAFAGVLGYATYQAIEASRELERLESGFELTGRGASVSQGFIEQWVTSTWKLFDSTGETTKKIVEMEAANGALNATVINAANQIIPLFIKQYGEDAPKAMEHLLNALSNLTINGFEKLNREQLNLSPTQFATIENLIRTGQETQAATSIIEALAERGGIAIKSLQQNLQDLQGEAVKLRAQFLTDQDATDGLTRASQEYLRVLREIQGIKQAITNAPADDAAKTFEAEISLAGEVNAKLDQRAQLVQKIATLNAGLVNAEKIGDQDLINSFTSAIAKEQADLTAIDKRAADQRAAQEKAANEKRLAEERRTNAALIQDIIGTADQIEQILQRDTDNANRLGRQQLADKQRDLDQAVALRQMSADEELQVLIDLYNQEADLEIQRLKDHQRNNADDVRIYDEDAQKILAVYQWLFAEIDKLQTGSVTKQQQEIERLAKQYEQAFRPITSGFNTMIRGMLSGQQTFGQAVRQGLATMLTDAIQADIQRLEHWIFTEVAKEQATVTSNAVIGASNSSTDDQSIGDHIASAIKSIETDAAKTYAAVFAWAAPEMGPFAAIPAAAATALVIGAEALIPSLDVGTWYVPNDGLAMIHQGETVMPAFESSLFRNFIANGGGAGNGGGGAPNVVINNNINATDASSVVRLLKNRQTMRQMAKAYQSHLALNPRSRGAY